MARIFRKCTGHMAEGKRCNLVKCKHKDWAYWIDFKDAQGRRIRKRIGTDRRVAEDILKGAEGNVARRQHLGLIDDSKISFAEFVDKPAKGRVSWWAECAPRFRPRTRDRWRSILDKHLLPAFNGSLRGIRAADVERYLSRRLKEGAAPQTVRQEFTVLSHILRRAVTWELLGRNPLLDSQGKLLPGLKIKATPGRVRFLSATEIERLLAACGKKPLLREFVVVALNTGCRRNELLSLTRRTIDWERRTATLEETKNGERRTVPLNEVAFDTLKSLPTPLSKDGPLFPFAPGWLSVTFKRVAAKGGIADFHLHDLRHCFATAHAVGGTSMRGLQSLLGHRSAAMTQRYAHFSDDALRTAVEEVQIGGPATAGGGKA
jgi:integrase